MERRLLSFGPRVSRDSLKWRMVPWTWYGNASKRFLKRMRRDHTLSAADPAAMYTGSSKFTYCWKSELWPGVRRSEC